MEQQPERDGSRAPGERGVAAEEASRDALKDPAGGRYGNVVQVEQDGEQAIEKRDRRAGKQYTLQIRVARPVESCRDRRHRRLVEERLRIPYGLACPSIKS